MATIIIQARLTSSRLPGKAMLSIGGKPVVVLAALRAANSGLEVRVATSSDDSDNPITRIVEQHGVKVIRGSSDDVLGRFVLATEDLPETETVIRLTADNVFPDGAFVRELINAFEKSGISYLSSDSLYKSLPYGMRAEAFSVAVLREADRKTESAFDREHVTPWIIRHYAKCNMDIPGTLNANIRLRATIDSIDDYERTARVFTGIEDPVTVSWKELCSRLSMDAGERFPSRSVAGEWVSELTLGTAQLGLPDYGRTNSTGQPSHRSAVALVREAISRGVDVFDTARAYGSAEHVLGEALKPFGGRIRVVTKLDPMINLDHDATRLEVRNAVDASVFRSCRELNTDSIPVLLLHRWTHRKRYNHAIWERLLELKAEGVIGRLGVSATSPEEGIEALEDPDVNVIQMPFNILDHRWQAAGIDRLVKQRVDMMVQVRSVLLQGILVAPAGVWPPIPELKPKQIIAQLDKLARCMGRVDRADLCLAYVRAQPWVHSLVIGVEVTNQLLDLIQRFKCPPLSISEAEVVRKSLPTMPEALLNPSCWSHK